MTMQEIFPANWPNLAGAKESGQVNIPDDLLNGCN